MPLPRPADQIADAREWANRIRQANPQRWGFGTCGDPADIVNTPARRALGLRPIHQCVLRQIAAAQLTEGETA